LGSTGKKCPVGFLHVVSISANTLPRIGQAFKIMVKVTCLFKDSFSLHGICLFCWAMALKEETKCKSKHPIRENTMNKMKGPTSKKTKEPPKRANHKGNIMFSNPNHLKGQITRGTSCSQTPPITRSISNKERGGLLEKRSSLEKLEHITCCL
jgi:hypothetical protein